MDLVVIVDHVETWLSIGGWMGRFGQYRHTVDEDWGPVHSRRIYYTDGPEVEFGFTTPTWASPPLDRGTTAVIQDGFRVLFDPSGLLGAAVQEATAGRT